MPAWQAGENQAKNSTKISVTIWVVLAVVTIAGKSFPRRKSSRHEGLGVYIDPI